jgi:cbb3-type cytochrome oxidase maturation protein
MSESVMILMISVSTFLGAVGLMALLWAVKSGQFDDKHKFIDAVHHDNQEDLNDAVMMDKKRKAYEEKRRKKAQIEAEILEKERNYRPPD